MSDESVDRIAGCYINRGGAVERTAAVYNAGGPEWAVTVGPGGFIEVLDGRGDSEMRFGIGTKIRALDGGGFVIEGSGYPGPVPSNGLIEINSPPTAL